MCCALLYVINVAVIVKFPVQMDLVCVTFGFRSKCFECYVSAFYALNLT